MTRGIEEMLGLPPTPGPGQGYGTTPEAPMSPAESQLAMVDGRDHAEAMDTIYQDTLRHARDIMELGFNIDHARAARMFEVGAAMFGRAIDAKNSKRDAQIKAMRLALDQRKLEILEKQGGDPKAIEGDASILVTDDRNSLIRHIREQLKKDV